MRIRYYHRCCRYTLDFNIIHCCVKTPSFGLKIISCFITKIYRGLRKLIYAALKLISCSLKNIFPRGKKKKKKSPGSATITKRSPFQTPSGRGNRQIQTSTNRTNVRKALRLTLSSPSEVIAMLKRLKTQQNDTT